MGVLWGERAAKRGSKCTSSSRPKQVLFLANLAFNYQNSKRRKDWLHPVQPLIGSAP